MTQIEKLIARLVQLVEDNPGQMITIVIAVDEDGYIYLEDLDATCTSGIFEVMIEVYAGPDDAEGTDSLTED